METLQNWAKNLTYSTRRLYTPESLEELRTLVKASPRLKVLGTGHSFNTIGDTDAALVSLSRFNKVVQLDPEKRRVTVGAGMRYGELAVYLHRHGYALHNLASLPHISVVGACMTATHGSGDGLGNLATAVVGMEMVTAEGDVIALSADEADDRFWGAVVSLGALGVVTHVTLQIEPAFDVRQAVYLDLPLKAALDHLEALFQSGYSVSLFTDWRAERFHQVWVKRRVQEDEFPGEVYGAKLAPAPVHPVAGHSPEACTEQLGRPGPWHERLPHFRMEHTPSSGEELQSEYFVPRPFAPAALSAVARLREQIAPILHVMEMRSIARDRLWLSPCYQQEMIGFHFTWKKDWPAVRRVLPAIEAALAPYRARPHWGKLFTMSPRRVRALYERLVDFRTLALELDPQGKFRNAFLDEYLFIH